MGVVIHMDMDYLDCLTEDGRPGLSANYYSIQTAKELNLELVNQDSLMHSQTNVFGTMLIITLITSPDDIVIIPMELYY